jgi:hypothetical protein
MAKEMYFGDFSLVLTNENQEIEGLTYIGYTVFVRYKRGQTDFRVT